MMDFRLLGDVEVRAEDGSLVALGAKQRAVLTVLLDRANAVVSRAEIVRLVWGARAQDWPLTAERMVADYVSRLRGALAKAGAGERVQLVARAPGYAAELDPQLVDWHRFRDLSGRGRAAHHIGDGTKAVPLLRAGLQLWRGPALADLPGRSLDPLRTRMNDLRLAAAEDLAAVEVERGAAGMVVDLLGELSVANPGRERLATLLIRALLAIGRRDDAVGVYQRARAHLTEELGLDPTGALEEAYRTVLAGTAPASRATAGRHVRTRWPSRAPRPSEHPADPRRPRRASRANTADPDARAVLYHGLLSGKRMLIVLYGASTPLTPDRCYPPPPPHWPS